MLCLLVTMSAWQNEDEMKAELRVLTDELRRLREGLQNMVSPRARQDPSRVFLHRQSWPTRVEAPQVAPDRPPRTRKKAPR